MPGDGCDKMLTLRAVLEAYERLMARLVFFESFEFEEDQHYSS